MTDENDRPNDRQKMTVHMTRENDLWVTNDYDQWT